jgi:hypothetical protein
MTWSPEDDRSPLDRILNPTGQTADERERQRAQDEAKGELLRLTMPAFSGCFVRCPKCGMEGHQNTQYCHAGRFPSLLGKGDGLLRNCTRCGFGWFECCADEREPAPPSAGWPRVRRWFWTRLGGPHA